VDCHQHSVVLEGELDIEGSLFAGMAKEREV
jgi:hypothetical protein